jgi:predicted MFS family arabinose efflux permease
VLAYIFASGAFELWEIYALEFLAEAFGATWALVTDFSVVPSLVEEDELTQANAVYLGTDRGVRAIGPALAGIAIATVGIPLALVVTAFTFLATATVIFFMPADYRLTERPSEFTVRRFAGEVGEGFAFVFGHPILRALGILMFVANIGGAGLQTILVYYLREERGFDPGSIGLALSFMGVAAIVGAVLAPRLAEGRPLGNTMLGMATLAAALTAIATYTSDLRAVVGGVAGRSFTQSAHVVYAFIPRQREIPPRLRGRANGAFRQMVIVGNALSPAVLAAAVDRFSTSVAFGLASALMLTAAAITYFSPLRQYDIRPVDTEPLAAAEEAETTAK